ncbi:MAG TPA: cytochrome c biogenesis protein CcdA [Candidatus Limnocylindria bacterium]|nr:cytochrome c biogenesis protein CcdA [Candidatus Limnocylindria bacterium]
MDPALGLAFGAGVLAIANPCALGMIPAYLALHGGRTGLAAATTGLLALVLGFVSVFAAVALALALFGHALLRAAPFVAGGIGLVLLALGFVTLLGRTVHLALPGARVAGGGPRFGARLAFGATYALASLGCALPIFLAFTGVALTDRDAAGLLGTLVAFALGTAASLVALVALGAATGFAGRFLRSPALARYGGGALLSAAGLYLLYLQLGFLIGYPFGIPVITLPL